MENLLPAHGREMRTISANNDPILASYLEAADEEDRQRALEAIVVVHAQPVARRVLARFRSAQSALSKEDADDIVATVHLRLVGKLRAARIAETEAVTRLEDYVATLTYHAVYDFLRRRYPERTRLKNRIRYRLANDSRFVVWQTPAGTACGLASWGAAPRLIANALQADEWSASVLPRNEPSEAVLTVLTHVNGPMLLDDVVRVLTEVWQVGETREEHDIALADLAPTPASHAEARDFIVALWREIGELPANQRAALLLNLRDSEGGNAVAHLVLLGVATFDDVAVAIGLDAVAFADLWNDLPLDDLKIAAMLRLSRQQVINLRKSARARLARRLSREGR